jgi:hypothetical protein
MGRPNVLDALKMKGAIMGKNTLPIINGQTGIQEVHYFRGYLNQLAPDNGNIVLSRNDDEVGVRSLKGNKLTKGQQIFVIGVRALFDTTADIQSDAVKLRTVAAWKSEAPAVFKNGVVEIRQGITATKLTGTVISPFGVTAQKEEDKFFFLDIPFLISDEKEWNIQANLAGTAAADQAFNIELLTVTYNDVQNAV